MPKPTMREILLYMLTPVQPEGKPTYRVMFVDGDIQHHKNAYNRTIHLASRLHPWKEYNLSARIEYDDNDGVKTVTFPCDTVIAFAVINFSDVQKNIQDYLKATFPDAEINPIIINHTIFYPLNLQQTEMLKELLDVSSNASHELEKVIEHFKNPQMTYQNFDTHEEKSSRKKTVGKFMLAATLFFAVGVALTFIPGIHGWMFNAVLISFNHFGVNPSLMTPFVEKVIGGATALALGSLAMCGGYIAYKQYQKSHRSDEFGSGDGFVASVASRFNNALDSASQTLSFRGSNKQTPAAPSSDDKSFFFPDSRP